MGRKIIIKKLDHTGHSTMNLSLENAYEFIENEISLGNLIYSPELKNVFNNFGSFMQHVGKIKEVLVIPSVIGG